MITSLTKWLLRLLQISGMFKTSQNRLRLIKPCIFHLSKHPNMKKHILYFTSLIIASSCSEAIKQPDLNSELEKWKLEMQSNGIVGPPCIEDYEKWSIENPNDYYGLQDVTTLEDDFNSDGIKDA